MYIDMHHSLLKQLPKHLLTKIFRYTIVFRPRYLDHGFFRIPIKKQWCVFCGEKVPRGLSTPMTLKCSDCLEVMCLLCVRRRSTPHKYAECCNSRTRTLCLC